MAPTKTTTPIKATRITYTSITAFDVVESRLRDSIQKDPSSNWTTLKTSGLQNSTPSTVRETFTTAVESTIGSHGFMHFYEVDHGAWLPIFLGTEKKFVSTDGKPLKCKRFILGNPLIAIGMMRWDVNAGLYAPTELLLVEEEGGGCRCVYQLPSRLVAGFEGAGKELIEGAEVLDRKLEGLVVDVLRD